MLTQERLKELLDYNPKTGKFTWIVSRRCVQAGDNAGSRRKDGYLAICIDGKKYLGHVLAWLYINGEYVTMLDHRDTNRSNDRISNLRPCTKSQNMQNRKRQANNSLGYKNIYLKRDKFRTKPFKVEVNGIGMGYFSTLEKAIEARNKALLELHGEFANFDDS